MAQAIKYQLVAAPTAEKLSELVCRNLDEGWRLFRGPFAEQGRRFQAMVFKGDKRLRKTSGEGFEGEGS